MTNGNHLIFGTGVSSCKEEAGLEAVIRSAMENGIRRFDTAPSYRTESVLGRILRRLTEEMSIWREEMFVQTKIDAWQMQEGNGDVRKYVVAVLREMSLDYLDALLIHWPVPEYTEQTWSSFVAMQKEGLVKNIGICNVRMRHLERSLAAEYPPQIVQIERNPLRTCYPEIAFCRAHGIAVQAYSPLCKMEPRLRESELLHDLAAKYRKSIGQIILRWHLDTGVSPIYTTTKADRAAEYARLEDFSLQSDEIAAIDGLNAEYKMYLESCACPGI